MSIYTCKLGFLFSSKFISKCMEKYDEIKRINF